jgi:hypothetical protein
VNFKVNIEGDYMKRKKMILTLFASSILIISGCSSAEKSENAPKTEQEQHINTDGHSETTKHAANGDLQEETKSVDTLPAFLKDKPESMVTIYSAAAKSKDLLESMPCYCGCGESANHKSNYDCFVAENKKDGSIVWDDHGTRCGVCLEIAAESVVQYNDGKSAKEIREYIDNKYKEGYAKPTQTPMPKA